MKKKSVFITSISILSLGVLSAITTSLVSCSSTKNNNYNENFGYEGVETEKAYNPKDDQSLLNGNVKNKPLFKNSYKVTKRYDRNVQKKCYVSDVESNELFMGWPSINNNYNDPNTESYKKIQSNISSNSNFNVNEFLKNNNKYKGLSFVDPNFVISEIEQGTFKKHPAIDNMFGEYSIKDSQKAVEKVFSIAKNTPTYYMTGLYAPPGEVIEMIIPKDHIQEIKDKNIKISICEEWQEMVKNDNSHLATFRLPKMTTQFSLNNLIDNHSIEKPDGSIIIKFGSVYGGIISFWINNDLIEESGNINFIIRNAVEYLHYDLGITTDKEWFRLVNETCAPVFSINNDTNIFTKPFFEIHNYKAIDVMSSKAKKSSPLMLATVYRYQTMLAQYINGIDLFKNVKYKVIFFVNDYVAAGGAVNISGSYIQAPLDWCGNLLDENLDHFNPFYDWGTMHETNHSFEKYYLFNKKSGEVYNNLISVMNYSIISPFSSQRIINPNILNKGWSWTTTLYSIFNPKYKDGIFNVSNDDNNIQFGLFSLVHIMGSKKFVEYARMLSLAKNNENLRKINGKVYDFAAWCMYLICEFTRSDLSEYLEQVFSFYLSGPNFDNGMSQQSINDWHELKLIIKEKYLTYNPIANMYATQQGFKQKDGTYFYPGDSVRPAQIDCNSETIFNISKYTKFSFKYDQSKPIIIQSTKVVEKPKFGEIKSGTKENTYIYKPNNSSSNFNVIDDFVVEIIDNYQHVYRIKIKVQLVPLSKYINSIYTINREAEVNVNENKKFKIFDQIINTNPFNNKNIKTFFNNFDEYKDSIVINTDSDIQTHDNSIAKEDSVILENQIREVKFIYKPIKTGYYRINGNFLHDNSTNYDYGFVKNSNGDCFDLIENDRWLNNANGERYGKYFERETKPVLLQANQTYQFYFYSIIKKGNLETSNTFSEISLNYVGDNEQNLTNQISYENQPFVTEPTSFSNEDLHFLLDNSKIKYKDQYEVLSSIGIENIYTLSHYIGFKMLNLVDYVQIIDDIYQATIYSKNSLVDSSETTINRFLGIINNWFQVQDDPKDDLPTYFDFELNLKKPLKFQQINFRNYSNELSFQKIKVIDTSNGMEEVIYDDFVNNWWNDANIKLNKPHQFNSKIRFIISKSEDSRITTPSNYQKVAKQNLHNWIKMRDNSFVIKNYTIEYSYVDFIYDSYSPALNISNNWNVSSQDAFYNSRKLVSRISGSFISFECEDISELKIIGDKLNSNGKIEVYVDNKLMDTISIKNNEDIYFEILSTIKIDKSKKHQIKIVSKDVDKNNPISIQAIGFKK